MIVFNPIIDITVILLLAIAMTVSTIYTYWKVSGRLKTRQRLFLIISRLLATTLLILILLQPSKQLHDPIQQEKLKIGIAIDSSKSMLQNDMGGKRRIDYARDLALEKSSAGKTSIEFSSFDESSHLLSKEQLEKLRADGSSTHIHDSLKSLFLRQSSYGMKALVLLTDGHDLQEANINETSRLALSHHCKIYAIPIGHAGRVRDIHANLSASQDFIFKGNKVALNAYIRSRSCEYEKLNVQLFKGPKLIAQKEIDLEDHSEHNVTFESLESEKGISKYTVKVTKLDAEVDYKNNQSTVFVNCMDKQIKTLILEGQPHWDSTFLRRFLQKNKMVQLDSFTRYKQGNVSSTTHKAGTAMPQNTKDFRKYDIVLLGREVDQLIDEETTQALKDYVRQQGGVVIFTRGNAFNTKIGRSLQPVEWDEEGFDDIVLKATSEGQRLSLFKTLNSMSNDTNIPSLPLSRKIASKKPMTQYLAIAEDNNSENTQALVYRRFGKGQVMSFGVEGIWQWRFNRNYRADNDYYASFWDQSILWLIHNSEFLPGDLFSFRRDISNVELGDKINFSFSVRNPKDIPDKIPELTINLANSQVYHLQFQQDPKAPHRFTSSFVVAKEGFYTASMKDPKGTPMQLKFIGVHNSLEEKEVGVDVDYLKTLCLQTGGRLLSENDLGELEKLLGDNAAKSNHRRVHMKAVWDKMWLMYLICILLASDWYFRRKWGLC